MVKVSISSQAFDLLWLHRPSDWDNETYRVIDSLRRGRVAYGVGFAHAAECPPDVAKRLEQDCYTVANLVSGPTRAAIMKAAQRFAKTSKQAGR